MFYEGGPIFWLEFAVKDIEEFTISITPKNSNSKELWPEYGPHLELSDVQLIQSVKFFLQLVEALCAISRTVNKDNYLYATM